MSQRRQQHAALNSSGSDTDTALTFSLGERVSYETERIQKPIHVARKRNYLVSGLVWWDVCGSELLWEGSGYSLSFYSEWVRGILARSPDSMDKQCDSLIIDNN